jgi:hypothetical protein
MTAKVLNQEEALSEGADLWVLPAPIFSSWTKQLDWPLNLQISKASYYTGRKLSPELTQILQQNALRFDFADAEKRNLIIASQGLIPANRVMIIAGESWETWSKAAVEAWQDLGKPSARFFIPTFANWDKVKSSWPSAANSEAVQIVATES